MSQQTDVHMDEGEGRAEAEPANLGAYFLTVGLVTIAFGSVFLLVFSGVVAVLLLGVVVGVAIVSVAAGIYSDSNILFPEA